MKNILTNDFASELFDLSEDSIYNILEEFNENQNIDKTLTYVFIKAFYIHIAKVILDKENISLNFDEVYSKYRKSKCNIRTDIFDKYIADIQEQSEKINNYIIGLK